MPYISHLSYTRAQRGFSACLTSHPTSLVTTIAGPARHDNHHRRSRAISHPYRRAAPVARGVTRRTVAQTEFHVSMEAAGWCLPAPVVEATLRTLSHGWAPRTVTNHEGAVSRYERYCHRIGVPLHLVWPAHEPVLCAFAADHAGRVSKSTAQNELAGVKAHHTRLNLPWADSPRIRAILEGVERSRPAHSLQPPRPPVTLSMIRALVTDLSSSPTSLDFAVRACAVLAFWGQFRLGELLPTSQSAFSSTFHPTPASWKGGRSPAVSLPWTKTTRTRGALVPIFKQASRTCPVVNMEYYLARTPPSPGSALFVYERTDGRRIPLTKKVFLERVNTVWAVRGWARITGHSFRIGGTTELLRRGVPPEVVKMAGRWASDSFLRYWRKPEDILPMHIQDVVASAVR